jgi:uncharacterized protein
LASSDNPQPELQPAANSEPGTMLASSEEAPVSTLTGRPAPVENPIWNGWDVLLIAALTFLSMIVSQFGVTTVAHRFWFPNDSWRETFQKPIVLIISQCVLYVPVALSMIALIEGKYQTCFWQAVYWNWPRSIWKMITIGAAMLLVLTVMENVLPAPKDTPFEHLLDRPRDAYLIGFIAVTLGPLLEELFFRGLLYPVLARRWGMAWGVLLSALPFALLHLQQYGYAWVAFLVVLMVGIVCGSVRALTKSVGASFLVHVAYNGTEMLIALIATRGFTHMPKALAMLFLQ